MQVYSIVNQKGGVGKTTVTVNLAGHLARQGYSVLILDIDPQAHITHDLLTDETINQVEYTLSDIIRIDSGRKKNLHDAICTSSLYDIDVVKSDSFLRDVETTLETVGHREFISDLLQDVKDEYDYVLIDNPPNFKALSQSAAKVADKIIVPCLATKKSLIGYEDLLSELLLLFRKQELADIPVPVLGFWNAAQEHEISFRESVSYVKETALYGFDETLKLRFSKSLVDSASRKYTDIYAIKSKHELNDDYTKLAHAITEK